MTLFISNIDNPKGLKLAIFGGLQILRFLNGWGIKYFSQK